ncbi:MAG TPA: enoyl-CoA hydratase-related protein [Geobacterales bacterium]|nr:enoyl-CoA hydratase-related protein [Geobacterales bacterium]
MSSILLEKKEGIAKITLNRPEVLNALDGPSIELLDKTLSEIAKDESIRCVILTGTGRAFCVGIDLRYMKSFYEKGEKFDYGGFLRKNFNRIVLKIVSMPKPVISVINGVAAGAGIGLALSCDYKLMSEKASFVEAFLNVGLVPDTGSCFFVLKNLGLSRAMEFFTLGETIDAKKALELGLVNNVVEEDKLNSRAEEIAAKYASLPTKAIALTKKLVYYSLNHDLEDSLEYEAYLQDIAGATEDHAEGLKAFLEKRKPVFKGK